MYALIHNSQLILGPIPYNYRMINGELEELEIDARVTPRDYENIPIRFDDLTFLVPVTQIIPEYDARFQSVGNFTWEIIQENEIWPSGVEMTYPISNKTLEQIKEEYKKQLPDIRRQKETQIIDVTINDTIVQVSTAREERVSFVSKLVSSPGPHNFKFENNVWLQITTTELEYVISQIDAKVQEAFDWEYTKVQEIDACETGEDVYNVVIVEPVEEVIPDALS
jgi:hypothetical protein